MLLSKSSAKLLLCVHHFKFTLFLWMRIQPDQVSGIVFTIDKISDPDEIRKILPVISSAWGMPNLAAAFKDTINAMRFHGGLVAAAYDGDEMVGMQFSFPGHRRGKTYLYSHMTGIVENKKYSGSSSRCFASSPGFVTIG